MREDRVTEEEMKKSATRCEMTMRPVAFEVELRMRIKKSEPAN